jgi:hypothetical protein
VKDLPEFKEFDVFSMKKLLTMPVFSVTTSILLSYTPFIQCETLDLRNGKIGYEGAKAVAAVIKLNPSLRVLRLGGSSTTTTTTTEGKEELN